ncbi:MAG: hypothetical protein ACOYJS_06735, partial [Acutalibacteraceae bacterium]
MTPVMFADPSGCFAISTFLISLAVGWAVTTIASNLFGAHLVGGISSTVGGVQTIGVGISLLAFGPVGWVLGGIAITSGALSIAFGTAELQQHFTGNNWMKDAGMSNGWYNGLMIGNAIVGAAVSIGGVKYMNSMHGQRAYAYQNIGKYKYTKTVMNHSGERPYLYDISKQRMVIKNGTMTFDTKMSPSSIFAGGRNYNFAYGDWSLTVSNTYRTIYHFLY